ncbi:UDP-N-acetylglucosamine 2-epimerase (hydrolyzing) [Bradyrhizobium japonicum]|uniref:UDP-N-acetylglucosamine 2-epimerase n=1 Tax=Bradyrhizobium japonicum TaxID=375 RepID=UPI001BA6064D|nr:UDP-N-acetylglucosamine 2-epimerase [Bradyrhizobium japonicum]MBR0994722.1 UDP-N-acetylglucosamine 2-epimerase (hydrolyzing) [Bradyrhizobium japonicum]
MRPRKVCYITGTRADFGLMQSTLQRIHASDTFELSIIVTGMHLMVEHGFTVRQIEEATLPIVARVTVETGVPSGALMASNIGRMLIGFVSALQAIQPDVVLVLGDRGEMLAGALAAMHLDIPVAHIHGGERSGTVDEPVRHAISKLAHFHFVATEESRERLVRMGEAADRVSVVGAPGLDDVNNIILVRREDLCRRVGFDPHGLVGLFVYHPVLQEAASSEEHARNIVDAMLAKNLQVVALRPNSDAGSAGVRRMLENRAAAGEIYLATNLPRNEFLSWLAKTNLMAGNSSAGIIEAASFGTPVVNVGSRQNLRQRNSNVFDCTSDRNDLDRAIEAALSSPRFDGTNVYGDGQAGERIINLLAGIDLAGASSAKTNVY